MENGGLVDAWHGAEVAADLVIFEDNLPFAVGVLRDANILASSCLVALLVGLLDNDCILCARLHFDNSIENFFP